LRLGPLPIEITLSRKSGPTTAVESFRAQLEQPAEELAAKAGRFTELGTTGTQYFSGILVDEEYSPDLQGEKAIAVFDKMWRSDGDVGAAVRVCELPLERATWSVAPASDSSEDVAIAQFVHDNVFSGMAKTWEETLDDILSAYRFGFSVFEKVWTLSDDGKVRLRKLAHRLAKTIYRWYPGEDDELDRIQQRTWVQTGDTGAIKYIDIPAEKLVVFTIKRQGNNWQGVSLLRQAYFHWFIKTNLYRVDAIACERNAMGVPVFEEPANADQQQRDIAARVAASFHAHQKAYILVPYGWGFKLVGVDGQTKDVMPSIEHHGIMILKSVLATFLTLTKGGSYALSQDISTFFLQALKAIGSMICTQMNKVIRELVDYNFPNVERYPTMQVTDLDSRDMAAFARGVAQLFTAGALTTNAETENALRQMLGLPALSPEEIEARGGGETVDDESQGETTDEETPVETLRARRYVELLSRTNRRKAEALATGAAAAIAHRGKRLADGDLSEEDFLEEAEASLRQSYEDAYGLAGAEDAEWIDGEVTRQRTYLTGFAAAIVAGAPFWPGGEKEGEQAPSGSVQSPEGVEARAGLYGGGVWAAYQRGEAAGRSGGTAVWHCENDATSCEDCVGLDGEEWPVDQIPFFPGDAETQCLGNCRCYLTYSSDETDDEEESD
jgi:phage gp29-like protein